jgi:DNA invertase Pin-like site-specific DNA recombinase
MSNQPNARLYLRVSTNEQDLSRQEKLREEAEAKGYKVVATYSEKASGTKEDRPELQRMLSDLNVGDIIIAEHLDRITRLPMEQAESLMATIKAKGAIVSVPGLIDLPKVGEGLADIVMTAMQEMLLKMALYQCRQDWETRKQRQAEGIAIAKTKGVYKGRPPKTAKNNEILVLRGLDYTIAKIAATLNVSESQVKLILKKAA